VSSRARQYNRTGLDAVARRAPRMPGALQSGSLALRRAGA
jgi:hypothetical protein